MADDRFRASLAEVSAYECRAQAERASQRATAHLQRLRRLQTRQLAAIRKEVDAVAAGRDPTIVLHEFAEQFFWCLGDAGPSEAVARLQRDLGDRSGTVQASLGVCWMLKDRADLPSARQLLRVYAQRQTSPYVLPLLAGLGAQEGAGRPVLPALRPSALRSALVSYLLSELPTARHADSGVPGDTVDCRPRWYLETLRTEPNTVADMMVIVHRAQVRARQPVNAHLRAMARGDEGYAEVAPLAVKRLFGVFPTSCTLVQVEALRVVLRLATICMAPAGQSEQELSDLVSQRLARSDMDTAQRAHWLAMGMLLRPDQYRAASARFLSRGREQRRRHMAVALEAIKA